MLKLYSDLAQWYPLLTAPSDYEEEAAFYTKVIDEHATSKVTTLLELGSGPGANASYMKKRFEMVLVDLSPDMLRLCATLNPEVEQHVGDMRDIRLGRQFDAVFVHDAISYMATKADVDATVATVVAHLRPGGVALLCPDDLEENFTVGTEDGGHDGPDGRAVRYLSWSHKGPGEHTVSTDYAYMLRHPDGRVEVEHERHLTSRFPAATWFEIMKSHGLRPHQVELEHTEIEPGSHHILVGIKE